MLWHETDFYGMICLSTITYVDKEWGYGDEPAELFNPSKFDAKKMLSQMKDAGMKGVLVVAKHHGGFCLWPTATTEYSVKNSPWRDGKGDMIQEFADAAKDLDMRLGLYLSPWDRNDASYGTPQYIEHFRSQLTELHTNYGELFLSWFDGANGGDGYYGGARDKREIDRTSYYDWDNTWNIVRRLQPNSSIFSDIGWDIRWVGNEKGFGGETCWATYTPKGLIDDDKPGNGFVKDWLATEGNRDGKYWMPAECDVPLRPGWFYHASEDDKVKSAETLFDLYFKSIGRSCAFDLGLAPNTDGELHANDVAALKGLGELIRQTFDTNLASKTKAKASANDSRSSAYNASKLIDGDKTSFWSPSDEIKEGVIEIEFKEATLFNIVSLSEYIQLGQRIDRIQVHYFDGTDWLLFSHATSIGAKRLLREMPVKANKIRVSTWGPVCPALSEIAVYLEPERMSMYLVK
ncbi:hypothetical protein AwDysgo_21040 [Bacteroidales bacterium]|nr:hypothetical protein AwDysgo_21040 [Bacteroidales bacterium]